MALTPARVNVAVDAALADFDWIQLHDGDPGGAGTANVAAEVAGRLAIVFDASAGGASDGTVSFAITGAGGPYTHVTGWSASVAGTWQGTGVLSPAESFAGAGDLAVTVTLTGTAS